MAEDKKPMGVYVVSWTWILTGALMAAGLLLPLMLSSGVDMSELTPEMPQGFETITTVLEHRLLLTVSQIPIALLSIVAGIGFLGLRSWARVSLEILSWLSVLSAVGFGVFAWFAWPLMLDKAAGGQDIGVDGDMIKTAGQAIGVLMAVALAIPYAGMILYLRGRTIRDAVRRR